MPPFTERYRSLPVYMLASIPSKKRDLLARGMDVIDLGAGDADLAPPDAAVERLQRAATESRLWRYGFTMGLPEFREAAAAFMQRRFGLAFDPMAELHPLIGSKEGIGHLALAYAQQGDVTVIPEPGYLSYLGGTLLSDAFPYYFPLRPRTRFLVEPDEIAEDVLRRVRILYLNYPNNPTAAVAPREYLERMVSFCRRRDILLVYDNAYSELAFDGYVPPSIFEIDGARECAIEFHSVSKTFNMTGARLGWAVGPRETIGALAKVKSFLDTGPFLAVQAAGAAALASWESFMPGQVATFKARRDAAHAAFTAAGFAGELPRATMYLWLALPEGLPSATFAERLMGDEGVIVIPGSAFGDGGEGFFRVSLTVEPDRLREAAERAGRVLARLAVPAAAN